MHARLGVVLSLVVLVFGLLAVAQTSVPETPGAHVGGTVMVGVSQTFIDMDPRISNSAYDSYIIDSVFDELIALDQETLAPIPYIAKSWEVAEDGSSTTFYLNEEIKFHNGEDLTAEDVAYTFNWIIDPANGSPNATEFEWMQEAVVIDDYTVKIANKPEWTPYCPGLVSESFAIVPKDTCEEMGPDAFNLEPVGSGPYKFVEWMTGDHITLERNENWWLAYPNLDKIVFRPIPNLATMMLELEAGGVDIVDNMPAQDVPRFQADPNVVVQQVPSLSYFHVGFNHSHLPSSDVRFRKAVGMSIDLDAAIFSIFQGLTGIRAYGVTPAALWANDREYLQANALEEDDEEAKRLFQELKEEGIIPEDFETTIYCPLDPRRVQLSTILATNLQENGITAHVQPLDWGPLLDLLYRSEADPLGEDFEIYVMGWIGSPDPDSFIYYLFTTENATIGNANNFSWYSNPEVDRLVKEAATTSGCDQATREALYIEAQRIAFIEDYCDLTGYHYIETQGVRARVHDYHLNALGEVEFCSPSNNAWVDE